MHISTFDEIAALGSEINANQYKIVSLAAQYLADLEWYAEGRKSAAHLAGEEFDTERDLRLHDARHLSVHTDGDGMVVIRAAFPPEIGKPMVAAIDSIVRHVAATPLSDIDDGPVDDGVVVR